jgi:hypothetical protein
MNYLTQTFNIGNDSLKGISIDAIFATLTSISIFILGYIVNRIIESSKRKRELKELREYYLVLVEDVFEPINSYVELLKGLSVKIKELRIQNYNIEGPIGLIFSKFTSLNQQDLYAAFVKNKRKLKKERYYQFKSFVDNIEYLRILTKDIKDEFFKYMESHDNYLKTWNENIEFIGRKYEAYLQKLITYNVLIASDSFLHDMDTITHNWSVQDNYRNIDIAITNYIQPLRDLTNRYRGDARSVELLPSIMQCISAHENMVNLKKFYSDVYNQLADKFENINGSLKKAVIFFK